MNRDANGDMIDPIDQSTMTDTQNSPTGEEDPQDTFTSSEGNGQSSADMVTMERYRNAQALMTKATMEAANLRKEVARLQAQLDTVTRYAPQSQNQEVGGSDFKDLEKLREEYPDLATPLLTAFEKQQQMLQQLQRSNEANERANEAARRSSFNFEVARVHPDFETVARSEDFQGWLHRQATFIQAAVASTSATDAIEVLNMYKRSMGVKTDKLAASRQVAPPAVGRNSRQPNMDKPLEFTREMIARMSPAEFSKYEAEIDKALAAGSIH